MTLRELARQRDTDGDPQVEVHGIGPMLYLLYVVEGNHRRPVQDERGRTLRFPSRAAAQQALEHCGILRATFVHSSPYGEMIGVTGSGSDTELRETMILTDRTRGSERPS
jgi:hypothetical protein